MQIHTGIGDRDADLRRCDPSYFRAILEAQTFAKTNFVFLHCYPFVRQAAILASLYANVYFDLSLSVTLNSPQAANLFVDALSIAPFTKILMGTDGHSVPETYWYASLSMRAGLSAALSSLIGQSFLTEEEAMDIAAHLLHKNSERLYRFDDD
jgi:predicted TIM-barrel fold metal-dependent hydrolase